jgi:hypothetical protein
MCWFSAYPLSRPLVQCALLGAEQQDRFICGLKVFKSRESFHATTFMTEGYTDFSAIGDDQVYYSDNSHQLEEIATIYICPDRYGLCINLIIPKAFFLYQSKLLPMKNFF